MTNSRLTRKARFKAALALRELTQKEWAEQHGKVTPQHLRMTLADERESRTLIEKVDAFIEETEQRAARRKSAA